MNEHEDFGSQSKDANLFSYSLQDPINNIDPDGKLAYLLVCVPIAHGECLKNKIQKRADACGGDSSSTFEDIVSTVTNAVSDSFSCLREAAQQCYEIMTNNTLKPQEVIL